ncbi:MAG: cytochrome c biogenesis protein CcdA [bacterium]
MSDIGAHFQTYLAGAPLLAFCAAFLAGVLASLTPCVYPMIPITAAYIGGSSAGGTRGRSALMAVFYVLGISVMYSALGATAAFTGRIFGTFASSPYINLALANVFILLGLGMLDALTIPMPEFLANLGSKQKKGGFVGSFLLGMASGFVATPCTTPVVLAILTLVAKRQNVLYGTALLFSFSLGLSMLLVVVGIFAGSVASLPKSGEWMVKIKHIFGWLMIVCAEYFLIQAGKMWL